MINLLPTFSGMAVGAALVMLFKNKNQPQQKSKNGCGCACEHDTSETPAQREEK